MSRHPNRKHLSAVAAAMLAGLLALPGTAAADRDDDRGRGRDWGRDHGRPSYVLVPAKCRDGRCSYGQRKGHHDRRGDWHRAERWYHRDRWDHRERRVYRDGPRYDRREPVVVYDDPPRSRPSSDITIIYRGGW